MRILVSLTARRDCAYQDTWHDKVRGVVWNALDADGSPWIDLHDSGGLSPFTFSNPFPPRDMTAGDRRYLIVASPYDDLLAHVAADLLGDHDQGRRRSDREQRELNIGEMPFRVDDVKPVDPDVGPPGTSGTMRTDTGVLVAIPPERCTEYGIEHPADDTDEEPTTDVYWLPEHTTRPFFDRVEQNLATKHRVFGDPSRGDSITPPAERSAAATDGGRSADAAGMGESDIGGPLFDEFELVKTFAVPLTVTQGHTSPHVLSKWEFGYTVRNQEHRARLNTALDCGIGHRNALGLGFCNLPDSERGA